MNLGYFFMIISTMMALMVGMMSWLLGSLSMLQSTRTISVTLMVGVTLAFSGLFALVGYTLPGADNLSMLWTAAAGFVAGLVPMPFILREGRNRASTIMAKTQATAAFANAAFNQLVEPGKDYITEESLRRLLRIPSTSNETRRGIGALLAEFHDIGTKIGEEKGYYFSHDTTPSEFEYTVDYLAITRDSLDAWPKAVHEKRRSWLR